MTCVHTNAHHHGCVPHIVTVLKFKNHGIPDILSLNSIVSIADHGHIRFVQDNPLKLPLKFYYINIIIMGMKSNDTAFWGEHAIISYLLWCTVMYNHCT